MKKLLYFVGSALLRKWFLAGSASYGSQPPAALPKFNIPYIGEMARKVVFSVSGAFVGTLFLVGGILMSLFAMAQNLEQTGSFAPGAIFFMGLGIALVSAVAVFASYYSLRHLHIETEKVYLLEPVPEAEMGPRSPLEYLGLVQPFLHGLVEGWKKERRQSGWAKSYAPDKPYAPHPAFTDEGSSDIRAS